MCSRHCCLAAGKTRPCDDDVWQMWIARGLEAINPASYYLNTPLLMHRTPLDWLKAGCRGAVVVVPHVAARMLLDLPGKVAAQDEVHGQELERLRRSVLPVDQILVPTIKEGLAA